MSGLTVTDIQNKWKSLRKDYKAVTILLNEGGVLWDPTLGTVIGTDDGWWDTMVQECQETKRFRHCGCAHIYRIDMLWKDLAKGKKVKLEVAACDSDSLQRHELLGGLLRPPSKWAPIVCPYDIHGHGFEEAPFGGGSESSLDRESPGD
ncbi:hypothetical protein CJ030_MR4G009209 [Morella rubra]|uniref:Myb/SANT-like domain-containing protein n=1 Tax=Morella rubra TaxID=262757 RepID=A0A6A1VS13_9ROSI|nr:hypothetical protein CJ030_MR4G009209 [Morella rubra]